MGDKAPKKVFVEQQPFKKNVLSNTRHETDKTCSLLRLDNTEQTGKTCRAKDDYSHKELFK